MEIVVGNKADLVAVKQTNNEYKIPENIESYYLARRFCERNKMVLQNVSAKLNSCVTDCFVLMIKEILSKKRQLRTSRIDLESSFHIT